VALSSEANRKVIINVVDGITLDCRSLVSPASANCKLLPGAQAALEFQWVTLIELWPSLMSTVKLSTAGKNLKKSSFDDQDEVIGLNNRCVIGFHLQVIVLVLRLICRSAMAVNT
jgi:hypothetical protein